MHPLSESGDVGSLGQDVTTMRLRDLQERAIWKRSNRVLNRVQPLQTQAQKDRVAAAVRNPATVALLEESADEYARIQEWRRMRKDAQSMLVADTRQAIADALTELASETGRKRLARVRRYRERIE